MYKKVRLLCKGLFSEPFASASLHVLGRKKVEEERPSF
ncbi:hypothetical protein B4119_0800 [Parageobacillus caldoxylosilyticus]|uniref:Uncharacterized protein n=1 Tax=Saccharococcus caldoxylosilyticus TaxID=81408 RepID=A0A150M128_9BACL|nr:hypothetical protein B4119_0800 [Parageobacillus caldoxylosilyticus]